MADSILLGSDDVSVPAEQDRPAGRLGRPRKDAGEPRLVSHAQARRLLEQARAEGVDVTGPSGLLQQMMKSVLEVASYFDAIALSAQTALREAIGRHLLAEMITEREALGKELQRILDEKTNPWGITVQSVEIRDVRIPRELEDAMSRQAQAERERQARIILGTAETEIERKFLEAGTAYDGHPVALHLRAMNMLYEALKEKGSMVIVPSSAVETMGLGGILGAVGAASTEPKKGD